MPGPNEDTLFADNAIKLGYAKLEQVEECLKLQDRISRAGLKPKPLAQLMLAKGYISKDQIEKHMKAAKDLVKHALSLCKPRKDELLYAVIGAPARASIKNKEQIIEAASEYLDSVMIASEPFTVAYGLDLLEDTLVIDIGAGTVDLCRMHGTMPADEDQITLPTAGDWLDQQLMALFKKKAPSADFTIHKVKEIKEKYAFVSDSAEPVREEFLDPRGANPVEGAHVMVREWRPAPPEKGARIRGRAVTTGRQIRERPRQRGDQGSGLIRDGAEE